MQIQTARSRLLAMVLECCCSCSRFAGGGVHFFVEKGSLALLHFQSEFTRYGSIRASHPRISHRRVLRAILFPMCTGVPVVVRDVLELLPLVVPADARRHRRFLLRLGCFSFGKIFCLICDSHSSPCAGSGRHQSCRSRRTCVRTDAIILLRPPFDAFSVE